MTNLMFLLKRPESLRFRGRLAVHIQHLWAQEYQYYLGNHLQPPAPSLFSMATKHQGKLTGARKCSKALSSGISPCLQLGSWWLPDTSRWGTANLSQSQHREQCQDSSSCTSPAATVSVGGGSLVLLSFFASSIARLWNKEKQGSREQGRTLQVGISNLLLFLFLTVRLSLTSPTYFHFHRGEEVSVI